MVSNRREGSAEETVDSARTETNNIQENMGTETGGAMSGLKESKRLVRKYFLPECVDGKWTLKFLGSLVPSVLILYFRPVGLDMRQSMVLAGVLLAIIWWSANIVKKIPTSIFLLLVFCAVSQVEAEKIFAFPRSEVFPMLVVTYLFSQAISNAGILEKGIDPILRKMVRTPFQCILAIVAVLFLLAYVIPQPFARLIIIAAIFNDFLKKTTLPEKTRSVLLYGVFLFYTIVNMSSKDADMVLNYVASGFLEEGLTNSQWIREMFIPTLILCVLMIGVFWVLFRKHLKGLEIHTGKHEEVLFFSGRQKIAALIIGVTVLLWMTQTFHGLDSVLVTTVAVLGLFAVGILKWKDLRAVDVTTLVFLTAAFSIGGVMKACGAAAKVFGLFGHVFPEEFSILYILIMAGISMCLHMILGSNTTTLSVVVPGMMVLCGDRVPPSVIVFVAVVSVSFHALIPLHSVPMMIGTTDGYFPSGYVTKVGIPTTALVYLVLLGIYVPYWYFIGLI